MSGDVNDPHEFKLGLLYVEVFVEAGALTPLRHDGQLLGLDAPHEQQNIYMPEMKKEEREGWKC